MPADSPSEAPSENGTAPLESDASRAAQNVPAKIEQHDAQTLAIEWGDGVRSLIDVRLLRLACACAHCVDEWSGQALLAPDSVPMDVRPQSTHSVGRYAIQIHWSDGHNTGIYPFERIRTLSDESALTPSPTPTAAGEVLLPTANADSSSKDGKA